ncbi:8-amino-7-oxononanoate synthase [Allopusillimonas soli]|uniref:8-amino-7-ketopelargonate synthase n=1 Tax=Allopusillimonas soli TaxID=659016 RepID=A0A853F9R2_9BURK|nr:8-amino-7-oxononanoate synthase [Allopusillimonas soli]NYT36833.1 8-amino-7-oxononanoate synthase [Allopusillimonas soli]TEA75295.1 8-amino-7-oxononanoate synthase [Allopusillimonas soli]
MNRFDHLFIRHLKMAEERHQRRTVRAMVPQDNGRVSIDGRSLLNFSSNDYLGLSRHPDLISRVRQCVAQYGVGAQASRLICGTSDLHESIERKLAAAKGVESALLLASGWQANAAVLPAILQAGGEPRRSALVYTDRLNHASLHHGCQAAGVKQIRFRHNDLDHLDALLAADARRSAQRFIVTESVFSMDGDCSDVQRLADLASKYNAFLYLDEAHATGVMGPRGMGLSGLAPGGVDLAMGTFSKALGGFGAYVAGSRALCDYLVSRCSGFIYTTALPPAILGAIDAALDLIPRMDAERSRLAGHGRMLRDALHDMGLETSASASQIVPVFVGDEQRALALSAHLAQAGVLVSAIRPPTVPKGGCRLRIALSAAHSREDVQFLVDALREALLCKIAPLP